MTAEAVSEVRERSAPSARSRPRGPDLARAALLLCWVALLTYTLALGERVSSFDGLERSIRVGEVSSVEVSAPGLTAEDSGFVTQEVHWREGVFRHRTEVVMWVGERPEYVGSEDVTSVRHGRDIAPQLRSLASDLDVTRAPREWSSGQVYGWYVPGWVGAAALALTLITLGSLIGGPPTWRATKWAWFWLMATPVGLLAYLVLSGPTPGIPSPRSERPRLRGGWAFVLALVSASIFPTWWH